MSVFSFFYRIHSCFTPTSPSERERSKTSHTNRRFTGVLFSPSLWLLFCASKKTAESSQRSFRGNTNTTIAMTHKFLLMRFPNYLGKKIDNTWVSRVKETFFLHKTQKGAVKKWGFIPSQPLCISGDKMLIYFSSFSASCFSKRRIFFINSGRCERAASTLPHWAWVLAG